MLLIVDNTKRKMRNEVLKYFHSKGIPIAVTNSEHMDVFLPAEVIIVTEKYILEDVRYIAKMYGDPRIILYDENEDFHLFVCSVYEEYCRARCDGEFHHRVELSNGNFIFLRKSVFLTKTEMRILRMLLFYGTWITGEQLSFYCLKKARSDPESIAVHICNINKKMRAATGVDMIEKKRYVGYRIPEL